MPQICKKRKKQYALTVQQLEFWQSRHEAQLHTRHTQQKRRSLSYRTRQSSAVAGVPVDQPQYGLITQRFNAWPKMVHAVVVHSYPNP